MAFVLHQTWDAANPFRADAGRALAASGSLAPLLANGRDRYAWKTGATLLSLVVHILLLWLFLTRLAGNVGEEGGAGPGTSVLHSFTLSGSSAASPADAPPKSAEMVAPPPAPAQPSDVDASTPAELAAEWSVSRLPPAPAPPSPPSPAASAGAGPASSAGAAGGGGGGGEVYDPYAGAAPLRREAARAEAPSLGERVLGFLEFGSQASGGLTLDEAALETVRRTVASRLPGRRGTAELIVRVSPTGVVLEVSGLAGTAPPEARDALGRALVGKRLFLGNAVDAQTLSLPTLRFG